MVINGSNFGIVTADRTGTGRLNDLWEHFNNGVLTNDPICSSANTSAWSLATDNARVVGNAYAKRINPNPGGSPTSNDAGLNCGYTADVNGTLFVSYWTKVPATVTSGKNMRIRFNQASFEDFWTSTGSYSGSTADFNLRAASDTLIGSTGSQNFTKYTSGAQFTADQWTRVDMLFTGTDVSANLADAVSAASTTNSQQAWLIGKNGNNPVWSYRWALPVLNNVLVNIGAGKDNRHALNIVDLPASDYYGYDDVYVSFTQARVELCDSATWSTRTHCELQIPVTWTDTGSSIYLNQGSFASGSTAYLYVVDKNGVPSAGYPITFATQADTTSPAAPTGLAVN